MTSWPLPVEKKSKHLILPDWFSISITTGVIPGYCLMWLQKKLIFAAPFGTRKSLLWSLPLSLSNLDICATKDSREHFFHCLAELASAKLDNQVAFIRDTKFFADLEGGR